MDYSPGPQTASHTTTFLRPPGYPFVSKRLLVPFTLPQSDPNIIPPSPSSPRPNRHQQRSVRAFRARRRLEIISDGSLAQGIGTFG